MQTLDVLIPTLNRAPSLERAVRSVLEAEGVPGLLVHVTIILNHCTDDSAARMRALEAAAGGRLSVIAERRRGKSKALNAGLAATRGDVVGMIDDDEEVDRGWIATIARAFADESLDFIGGPYVARWSVPPPAWIPRDYLAVVGSADAGSTPRQYGRDFPGILKGGNAVIRRRTLYRVGPYAEHLGPGAFSRMFSCEDEEMYLRLLEHGARGRYLPDLVVYHHVSRERLTPEYFRHWCFWRGVSRGLMDFGNPLPVRYLAGVPRFMYGRALLGFRGITVNLLRGRPARDALSDELKIFDLAGYFYGRHVYALARFSPTRSRRIAPAAWPAPPLTASDDAAAAKSGIDELAARTS